MAFLLSLALASQALARPSPFGPPSGSGPGNFGGGGGSISPELALFASPLPIPQVAVPKFSETVNDTTIDYYEMTIESFQQQVYPNLGPANLVGYNGSAPGPMYIVERGHETIVRCLNQGSTSASMHLHGSYTHSPWDGWAADLIEVGQYKDYYYPNSEAGRAIWYHDHAAGHTANDAYFGQAGVYIIHDPAEDALGLPSGKYDIPLAITDKIYQSNGDLQAPSPNPINFLGDVIQVNEQPWPYLEVEPRKYRFRFYDMSLSRPYQLAFEESNGNTIPFSVIASDSGLFGSPVSSSELTLAMGERYEVVVDFSSYAGSNITLANTLSLPYITNYANTDKVMLFAVGKTVSDSSNNGPVPSTLNPSIQWPTPRTTVDHTFSFQFGGESTWTINGIDFNDVNNRVLAKPPQGTVELWEVRHTGGPAVHPVHIHLVNMQVVSRTGGSRGVLPYESAGLKDVVLLEPGEVVQILAFYGPWDGVYMFHCHNLVHEDHTMIDVFNVTHLAELGYEFNSTINFANPVDPRFVAQAYNAQAFEPAAVQSAMESLANLGAYGPPASSLIAAENSYYATAGYHGDSTPTAGPTTTSAPTTTKAPTTTSAPTSSPTVSTSKSSITSAPKTTGKPTSTVQSTPKTTLTTHGRP